MGWITAIMILIAILIVFLALPLESSEHSNDVAKGIGNAIAIVLTLAGVYGYYILTASHGGFPF